MKRVLQFASLTALIGMIFSRRRKDGVTPDNHCVWFVRSGGHHVFDDLSSRISVQAEPRLGRVRVRRRAAP